MLFWLRISNDIKWYELQIELTDHLVSIMKCGVQTELSSGKHQVEQRFEEII
jgi:hypothetical protein